MSRVLPAFMIALIGSGIFALGGIGVALALENNDSFCASCHTEPETTYFQRSIQIKSSDLAAYHTKQHTKCIDCHSASGTFGRTHGLQQGAKDLYNFVRGTYRQPAVTTNPLGDDACVKCHVDVYQRPAGAGKAGLNHYHFHLPLWHQVDSQAANCIACHPPHTLGLEGLKFMQQGRVGQLCEACHDALSGLIR